MPKDKAISFAANSEASKVLLTWWEGISEMHGDRAELRRACTPSEVAFCPSFHRLFRALRAIGNPSPVSMAVIAGVMAHVKENDDQVVFAAQMAAPKPANGPARVSGLRFRRLIQHADRNDLYLPLIRTVRLLEGRTNITDLANSILFWGEGIRREWAYAYYEHAPSEK